MADLEAQRRMLHMSMRHPEFATLANLPAAARAEYLMALRHQSDRPPITSQSVSSAAVHAAHQPSSTQQPGQHKQFGAPGVMGNINAARQQASQPVHTSMPGQVPNRGALGAHRAGNMHIPRNATMNPSTTNDQRAAQLATIAAAASNVGLKVSPEQIRNFSQDQLRRFFAIWTAQNAHMNAANQNAAAAAAATQQPPANLGRVNEGQAHANMNPGANWMGRMGNAAAVNQANMIAAQNNINHAIALKKQAMLQKAGEQQLQQTNAAARSNAALASHAAHAKRAVGMNPSQMNPLLSNQKTRHGKTGITPQDNQQAMAEALQNANRINNSRGLASASVGMVHGNAAMAAMSSAPLQHQPSEALQSAQKSSVPATAAATAAAAQEEKFWKRLEGIQRKYTASLNRILPFIPELHQKQPIPQQSQGVTLLRQCITVLQWRRGVSNLNKIGMSMSILDKTESFLSKLMTPNSMYTASQLQGNRSKPGRDASEANAAMNPGAKGLAQANAQAAMANAAARPSADANASHVSPRIAPSQLTPQQRLRFQQQQRVYQMQQQQSLQLLKEMSAAHSAQQRAGRPAVGITAGLDVSKHAAAAAAAAATPAARFKNARMRSQAPKAVSRSQAPPVSRQVQGLTMNQMPIPGRGQTQAELQAKTQAQVAQVGVRVPNPAAVQQHTQAQAQALAQAKASNPRVQQIQAQQAAAAAAAKAHHARRAATSGARATQSMTRTHSQSGTQSGLKRSESWGTHSQATAATGVTSAPPQVPQAAQPRDRRPEMSAQQKLQQIDNMVKEVSQQAHQLEQAYEMEAKRQKSERIQITLAALRNSSSASASDEAEKRGAKRKSSLADVENYEAADGVIETKTVFECSPETGLRLAKRPRNEAGDMQLMRDAVKMDVEAAKERNPSLSVEIIEEFGLPVVKCMLRIPGIRFPKLVLRVQRGYPRKGGATYGFERPPMGWVGILEQVRSRFKQVLSISPAASVGVAAILDAWASEADAVVNGSEVSDAKKAKEGEKA